MLAMVIWIGPGPVIARFERLIQRSTSARESRVAIWKDTLHLIGEHPWAGTGLGTFANVYPAVQTAFPGQTVGHAHNDYLEFASECGIPAALILFSSIFYIVAQSVRAFWKNKHNFQRAVALGCFGSMVAILLHSLTDFNLDIPANARWCSPSFWASPARILRSQEKPIKLKCAVRPIHDFFQGKYRDVFHERGHPVLRCDYRRCDGSSSGPHVPWRTRNGIVVANHFDQPGIDGLQLGPCAPDGERFRE